MRTRRPSRLHRSVPFRFYRAALVTSAMAAAVLASAVPASAQFEAARARIQRALVEGGVPSIAVAVARDGRIIWEEGFGWADRESRIPATEHTMYSLASISKPITTTGLMVLVERGEIDLDRPINDYLGAAKVNGRAFDVSQATVRRVANHSAGLPLHWQFFYRDEPYRRPAMDETIRRYANLITAPGERWSYSNLGFGILDYLLERGSGKSYPDFMREEVFTPLGLTRTSVHIGPGHDDHTATRYALDDTPIPFYDFDHPGGSAVFSSAHDLVRFGMFHLKNHLPDQKPILSDAAIDEMARGSAETTRNGWYGVGWQINETNKGGRTVHHGGGMDGVSTRLVMVPEGNVAMAILSNAANPWIGRIERDILHELFPQWFDAPEEPSAPTPEEPTTSPDFNPMPDLTGDWVGSVDTYEGERKLVLSVHANGAMYARLDDQPWALVNGIRFEDGALQGSFAGDVGTEDVNRMPYDLLLDLKHRGNVLNGGLVGRSRITPKRIGHGLTHWVELRRR